MRRRPVRLLLTLGIACLVAALVFGSARGSGTHDAFVQAGSPDAPAVGAPASARTTSPSKSVGVANPVRIASLRSLKSQPAVSAKLPEDFESYPARQPGSSTRDTVVQRTTEHNMPSPIENFD